MNFQDVNEIIYKRVLVKVMNVIKLTELLPYLRIWFDAMTYQPIEKYIENHGEAQTAATKFFDVFKSRFKCFPKLLAALKHTKQFEVYDIFIEEIKKFYEEKKNPDQCKKLLELIAKEERNLLGISTDVDDGKSREENAASGSSDGRSGGTGSAGRGDGDDDGGNRPGGANASPINRDKITAGACGTGPASGKGSSGPRGHSGCSKDKIKRLKYFVIKQLGKVLEELNVENQPWWEMILDSEDLEVSWEEQEDLQKSTNPGLDFLKLLRLRDYTVEQLQELFARLEIDCAQQILLDDQNKVIESRPKESSSPSSNNLNSSEHQKETPVKMNITGPLELSPVVEVDSPNRSPLRRSDTSTESIENNTLRRSDSSLDSIDNNTVIEDIVDASVKGTKAVQEHSTGRRAVEMDETPGTNQRAVETDEAPGTDQCATEMDEAQNISDGNLPILNNLQSPAHSIQLGRDGENINTDEEAVIRNTGTNVEAKPPRDGPDYVTGVNLVPASMSLPDSGSVQNNAASSPSESAARLDEASDVTSQLPTVLDSSMSSYTNMNISNITNESETENSEKPSNV